MLEMNDADYLEIINAVFKDFPLEMRQRISLICNGVDNEIVCNVSYKGIYAYAVARCSPQDEWNERTGILLALTRLRIDLITKMNLKIINVVDKSKKVWIPNVGDTYYVPLLIDSCFSKAMSYTSHIWKGDPLDFIRLSLGNIYKTRREAIKAGKRMVFDGQKLVKESKHARP